MSRELCHSLGPFTIIEPIPILSFCDAVRFRFARSERDYLRGLATEVGGMMGEGFSLNDAAGLGLPVGGSGGVAILSSLLDALEFKGPLERVTRIAESEPQHGWILPFFCFANPYKIKWNPICCA